MPKLYQFPKVGYNKIIFICFDAYSHGFPSVVGRDLLTLKDFKSDEIRYLLWTAADLKERIKNGKEVMQVMLLFTKIYALECYKLLV